MEKLFVPLMFFVTTILIVSILYIVVGTRHRERMAMLEKGFSPDQFPKTSDKSETLKWGIFLIGVGLGFLLAFITDHFVFISLESTEPLYPSFTAIFGGSSLVLYYKFFRQID